MASDFTTIIHDGNAHSGGWGKRHSTGFRGSIEIMIPGPVLIEDQDAYATRSLPHGQARNHDAASAIVAP